MENPKKITLLRLIPAMTFIQFVTGISSGILPGISSGICSGISSGIPSGVLSGISSGILSGISSGILSGKHSGTLSGISSGIPSGVLSGISSGILSGKSSGILSGKHSGTLSGISSGILSDILSGILSGIPSRILSGISSNILSGISSGTLSIWQILWHFIWHIFWHSIWHSNGHIYLLAFYLAVEVQRCALSWEGPRLRSSGAHWARKVPGWGPAVRTELGRSQVEVQRCALSWEGPRLRSSGAHWAGKVPGWGPAVRTELGRSQVEVQQCALSSEVGEELGEELARRKWRWKLMQTWSRRNWRRRRRRRRRRTTALIKSNNPHLADGEKCFIPCHLSSFSSDPLHGSIFFGFLEVLATLAQECPKTHVKTKKTKKTKRFCPVSPQTLSMGRFFFVCSRIPQNLWKNKKKHPMSPVQLLLRPSPWVDFFCFCFCFFEVFATLAQECPKTHGKTKEKVSSDPLHGSKLFVFVFVFGFLEVFCHFVSPTMSVAHFSCFLFSCFFGFLGEIFTLTSIHWHSFHSSTFYIGVFIELLILATEPSEKMYIQ